MKKPASFLIIIIMLFSSGYKENAELVNNSQSVIEKAIQGTQVTANDGYLMKATIDGKLWQSTSMAPVEASGRIVGYCNGQYIGLPFNKSYLVAGKKIAIDQEEAADLFLKDGCSYPITNGQMAITKVADNWVEGSFYFTTVCSTTNKTVKITEGFFRILIK
jgi:hypothetical protein